MKTVPYRRKREGKTDYRARRRLLSSHKLRVVVRKTNKHVILQLIRYATKGDIVEVGTSTKELEKQGWKGATSNITAAYYAGYLFGKRVGNKEVIADLGLQTSIKGGRLYAALYGAQQAGLNITLGEKVLPDKKRLEGEGTTLDKAMLQSIKKKIEATS